ncbi:hypothetical protein CSIM01_13443 [Colletotrichum simmondsii]|uniref:Uncharacterized protein n=1 Tax=Colletotrichum simmondsii TaxID=703756 RepID=A0A135S5D8_9PEZI|nr:hypothetical protein CSIM01_13443 [Colletotrichum simmondsii]
MSTLHELLTSFFVAFVIGGAWHLCIIIIIIINQPGVVELISYMGRFLSSNAPDLIGFCMTQALCLLMAPALFAASIYMVLGRLIIHLRSESLSPIKPSQLTKIFPIGDILSFIIQIMGAGMLASSSTMNTGKTAMLLGLIVQLIFFGLFVLSSAVFHSRVSKHMLPNLIEEEANTGWRRWFNDWRGVMSVLYIASVMIFVRWLFRLAEYVEGNDGALLGTGVFLYIFDALLMVGVEAITAVFHPAKLKFSFYTIKKSLMIRLITQALTSRELRQEGREQIQVFHQQGNFGGRSIALPCGPDGLAKVGHDGHGTGVTEVRILVARSLVSSPSPSAGGNAQRHPSPRQNCSRTYAQGQVVCQLDPIVLGKSIRGEGPASRIDVATTARNLSFGLSTIEAFELRMDSIRNRRKA